MVDAWRDALLKVKAVRARTGGGWRAEVAGRTRQTSARLLNSQPLDAAALRASLSPREQRLRRIVHEVALLTLNLTLTLTLTLTLSLTLTPTPRLSATSRRICPTSSTSARQVIRVRVRVSRVRARVRVRG